VVSERRLLDLAELRDIWRAASFCLRYQSAHRPQAQKCSCRWKGCAFLPECCEKQKAPVFL